MSCPACICAWGLALGLVELHEVRLRAPLQPVQVPLNYTASLQCVNHTTQLGVVSKLAEEALNSTVPVADKSVNQHQFQHLSLRNTTHHWSPLGH